MDRIEAILFDAVLTAKSDGFDKEIAALFILEEITQILLPIIDRAYGVTTH